MTKEKEQLLIEVFLSGKDPYSLGEERRQVNHVIRKYGYEPRLDVAGNIAKVHIEWNDVITRPFFERYKVDKDYTFARLIRDVRANIIVSGSQDNNVSGTTMRYKLRELGVRKLWKGVNEKWHYDRMIEVLYPKGEGYSLSVDRHEEFEGRFGIKPCVRYGERGMNIVTGKEWFKEYSISEWAIITGREFEDVVREYKGLYEGKKDCEKPFINMSVRGM